MLTVWLLVQRLVHNYYTEIYDALMAAAAGGVRYESFVDRLVGGAVPSFSTACDSHTRGSLFSHRTQERPSGLTQNCPRTQCTGCTSRFFTQAGTTRWRSITRPAAELFVEAMSAQERRGNGDVWDPASPRYVVWEEGRQPRNPLGQREGWVNTLWFREEEGVEEALAELAAADAEAARRAGGSSRIRCALRRSRSARRRGKRPGWTATRRLRFPSQDRGARRRRRSTLKKTRGSTLSEEFRGIREGTSRRAGEE